jgi:PAS domain S-box-containing protein
MVIKRFRNFLLFLCLFLVAISLIFISVYHYFSVEKSDIIKQNKEELRSISVLKIKEISGWYTDEISDAQTIASDLHLVGQVENWVLNPTVSSKNELIEILDQISREHGYLSVSVVSSDFLNFVTSSKEQGYFDSINVNLLKSNLFPGSGFSSDLYKCPISESICIDFIAPILNKKSEPIAVAIFRHNPDNFLFPLVQNWPVPSATSETLILRKEKDSILFLNNLRHVSNAALNLRISLDEKNVPAVIAANGYRGFVDGYDYRKVPVLAYVDSVPGTPWFFVAKVDQNELFDNLFFKTANPIAISLLLTFLISILFYLFYVNQQKNNFRKLYHSQQLFKTTLYSIGDAVITTDDYGRVKNVNHIAEVITGWTESEARERSIEEVFEIINEKNRKRVVNPVKNVIEKGIVEGLANHSLLVSKQGNEIPIAYSGAPIFDGNGTIVGVVLVFRDQTKERRQHNDMIEAQREMATLLSNLPGMAYQCLNDAGLTMEFVSRGCEALTGYFSSELENNQIVSYRDIIYSDDMQNVLREVKDAIDKHTVFQREYRINAKNGDVKWVWEKGQGIYNLSGELIAFEGFIIDISERKKAEESMRSSEHLFQTLAENTTVGIFRTDEYGLTTYVNPSLCELAGFKGDGTLKAGWIRCVHPDDYEEIEAGWERSFTDKNIWKAEYRFMHGDGKIVFVKGQAMPEFNEHRELVGYIGTISDNTESINASETLLNANKLLRTIIDNIPDPVFMKDMEGRKLFANFADVENCGCNSEEELLGKNDFDVYPQEIATKYWDDDQQVLLRGIPVLRKEEKLVTFRNITKWMITSKIPFRDLNGKIVGLIGVAHDITLLKRNEDEMLRLTKVITQSPVSIVITNMTGDIEYVNPKFSEVTGYSFDEVSGKNPRILKSGSQQSDFYSELWKTVLGGVDWHGELQNKKKNGDLFWENVIISPILNDEKEITHFVAIKEDITEKKKMLEELIQAKTKAEESDRLKSSFLANMSHEIRTPLNSILGFSNFLTSEDDLSSDEKVDFSNIINKSAESLLQIINDIIDISSLETGQLKTFFTHPQVNGILKSIHTVFLLKLIEINKSHLFLTLLLKEDISIYTDEHRLIQIFTNLLNNAVKFTSRGEIAFGVESYDDKKVNFIVSDTGMGIRPDVQESIFERFRQGEEDTTRKFGGNGLGLSIVKNLVELMGGKITLESELEVGSKFRFWLPRNS